MADALTLFEMHRKIFEAGTGIHIWIHMLDIDVIYAGIADHVDSVGVVGIWCAGNEQDWLTPEAYGAEWLAYLEKPDIKTERDFAGVHPNGTEPRSEIRKVEINPWLEAISRRRKKQRNLRFSNIKTAESVVKRVITARKQFLGSDLSVNKLVQVDGIAWREGVDVLACYLANAAYTIMRNEYSSKGNNESRREWFEGFFLYVTQLFACGRFQSCLDDYIKLAECFETNVTAIHVVLTENLPSELAEEAGKWVMQNVAAPLNLTECVTAAVACFTGAMVEPKEMGDGNNG